VGLTEIGDDSMKASEGSVGGVDAMMAYFVLGCSMSALC